LFLWLYRKNKWLALMGMPMLFSAMGFMLMILNYHLDTYRIFFLVVSWIWLAHTIRNGDRVSLFLLGVFTGFTAFAHLIGLVVALANIAAFFLFHDGHFKTRVLRTAVLALLVLGLGNIHYIMEILYGAVSGWASYLTAS
jgi:hypothetical protein